jgi:hypothetical protein
MTSATSAQILCVVAPLSIVECLGCQTIYRGRSDQKQHEQAFLCGPAKVLSLSPFAAMPPACSHEKPTRPVRDTRKFGE